mgnify:CR=1 FL=1
MGQLDPLAIDRQQREEQRLQRAEGEARAQDATRSSCRSAVQTLAKLVADPPRRDRRVADYIAARQHLDRANRACDGNQGERAMAEADAGIRRLAPDLRGGVLR